MIYLPLPWDYAMGSSVSAEKTPPEGFSLALVTCSVMAPGPPLLSDATSLVFQGLDTVRVKGFREWWKVKRMKVAEGKLHEGKESVATHSERGGIRKSERKRKSLYK